MSEFLKSAFDLFGSGAKSKNNNELVGNCIEIGNQSFKVLHTIAEGGFSVVFEAQDIKTNKCYALKRIISHDSETNKEIMQEINFLKKLYGHPNIIKLFTAASIGQERQRHVGTDFLIVTELCAGGQMIQLMHRRNKTFPYNVTIQIFNHVAAAIEHMHNQNPPIIHRDLKVENLLISCHGVIKLCDFGSATTVAHYPDNSWTGLKRSEVQEEIEKHTTPMYRTPEMLDLYQNYPINQACDIWALGCVLYYLCFNKHPFEDSAKLAILNANYTIPMNAEVNDSCCGLIYQMLLIDPNQRPKISEIISEIRVQASLAKIILGQTITFDKESLMNLPPLKQISNTEEMNLKANKPLPTRPQPPITKPLPKTPVRSQSKIKIHPTPSSPSQSTSTSDVQTNMQIKPNIPVSNVSVVPSINNSDSKKMFGIIKEGAGNIMKNIRDASNKVIEQVASSINKAELDLIYVTSRIIMMPTPGEIGIDTITRDKVEDVQTFLDFRHPNQYYIYNLSLRSIKTERFNERVMQLGFDSLKPMPFNNLVAICFHQLNWLLADNKNVIVIQCTDGRLGSGMNVAALLCFCRLVDTSSAAISIVKFRRGDCSFTASHLRYIDYVCRLMHNISNPSVRPEIPHKYIVKLTGIELEPVPIFNRAKTGVRPYIEIFSDYKLVYSSLKNYEDLCLFTFDHKNARISIPNVNVFGDLNIVIYHTRSNIVAKGKISSFKICETQIYTGYLPSNCTEITLKKNQLDHLDSDSEKYPSGFALKIQLHVTNKEEINSNQIQSLSWNSNKFKSEIIACASRDDRLVLFSNKDEMRSCILSSDVKLPLKDQKINHPKADETSTNFFQSLDWNTISPSENNESIDHASPIKSESPENNNFMNNNCNDKVHSLDIENIEAIGNLLGDFGTDYREIASNEIDVQVQNNDVEGLVDFFSSFPLANDNEYTTINKEKNLFNNELTSTSNDVNLLFFDSSTTEKSGDFLFDPFSNNLVNSSSTTNISSNSWINSQSNACIQPSFSTMKSSNSTNSLLNIGNSNIIKQSPSFNANSSQQKNSGSDFNISESYSSDKFEKGINNKLEMSFNKPVPPPKPQIEKKIFENVQFKKPKDAFKDLLGDFKPNEGSSNGSKTIRDIRKENLTKTKDPETLKILEWIDGKEKNIRALLCALSSVLWPGVKWNGVSMSELITVDQVKRAYRNAIRCVHPDKWNNTEYENFSKMIMIELNEAMSEFEAEKNSVN